MTSAGWDARDRDARKTSGIRRLLVANRGEVAIRIARAASEQGIETVAVHSADDARSLHTRGADEVRTLQGSGPSAYLDAEQLVTLALEAGCDAVHPGYGFLSESAAFARRCQQAGLTFVGPHPQTLVLFGDKTAARTFAQRCGVPILSGTNEATSLEKARSFRASLGPSEAMLIKALSGGGGRGIRVVAHSDDLDATYARAQSEARAAFGEGSVYVERLIPAARHIEVQVVGDGVQVAQLGERDCTLQRRRQKLVEIAPSPALSPELRERILGAALRLAGEAHYLSLGTMEFLVDTVDDSFYFIEANPRLQVEHTVTEEVTGLDLVGIQLAIAGGRSLADLGLAGGIPAPRRYAVEARVNLETMDALGQALPAAGTLRVYEPPCGPGVRVDGYGYTGYTTNPAFDSLLAKVIVTSRSPHFADAVAKAERTLGEFRVAGVATNIPFLRALLRRPEMAQHAVSTRFVEQHAQSLAQAAAALEIPPLTAAPPALEPSADTVPFERVGRPDALDELDEGTVAIRAPLIGQVVSIDVAPGDTLEIGQQVAVLEAMKMEHVVSAERSGIVRRVCAVPGETVAAGAALAILALVEVGAATGASEQPLDLDAVRLDLGEVIERHAIGLDARRPEAVARRRKTGQRTARENIADLCDPDTFVEYGALALAAQRSRRSLDELIRTTPADGFITGVGAVNGALFDAEHARCAVLAYDYTVLAGTQGMLNHRKLDRMLELAERWRLPVVLFGEGGGGRPGDTDAPGVAGLDLTSFARFAALSGQVPLLSIVSGRCFAGNAALVGCSDVIIATANANIGMGGPAMIEGGGLGVVAPEAIGPIDVQKRNGVVDLAVADEAAAVAAAKQYLAYFQGSIAAWEATDQRRLRWLVPENRLRVYDIRAGIQTLADSGSVLELRRAFGRGMVTALVRVEGRPFGLLANDPAHLGGAIEAEDADKAARFMRLCDTYGLPILALCDTPGFMVGPAVEERAQVRHVSRMFVAAAHLRVPYFTVVLRKGYGLGAMAMAGGGFHAPFLTAAWPTGEFGGMGLEGAVRLGYRRELEAVEDSREREALYQQLVAHSYEKGKALNMASHFEIDAVIDPMETRRWILDALRSLPSGTKPSSERRPPLDPW